MTLLQQTSDLLRQARDQHDQRTARAWHKPREILSRAEKPKPGDAKRLAELLDDLGIDPSQLPIDLERLQRAAALQAVIDQADERDAGRIAVTAAFGKHVEESRQAAMKAKEREGELSSAMMRANTRCREITEAQQDLHALKQANGYLFSD